MLKMFNRTGNINHIKKFKKLILKSLHIFWNSRSAHVLEFLDHVWNQSLVASSQSADPQNMDVCINRLLSCFSRSLKTQKYGQCQILWFYLIYMDISVCCSSKIHSFKDVCLWQEWSIKSGVDLFNIIFWFIFDFIDWLNNVHPQIQ